MVERGTVKLKLGDFWILDLSFYGSFTWGKLVSLCLSLPTYKMGTERLTCLTGISED